MNEPRLALIGYDYLEIDCPDEVSRSKISVVGGKRRLVRRNVVAVSFANERELADLLTRIQELGVVFESRTAGAPTDVFESLRKKGLVKGLVRTIVPTTTGIDIEER